VDWQFALVALAVAAAAAYLIRRAWRTWGASKGGCGGGCCAAGKAQALSSERPTTAVTLVSAEQLTARLRRRRSLP
jgi:hypothetical protein